MIKLQPDAAGTGLVIIRAGGTAYDIIDFRCNNGDYDISNGQSGKTAGHNKV
jgi:hypothetical protein